MGWGEPRTPIAMSCPWCGSWHNGVCARVESIEYHENGQIKLVRFRDHTVATGGLRPVVKPIRFGGHEPTAHLPVVVP